MAWRYRYKCPVCGKITRGRFPKGGDGTFHYPARHKGPNGSLCLGSFDEAEEITDWITASAEVDKFLKRNGLDNS